MATLYVNGATGNDSTTKANNTAETPWATIGRAAWGSTDRSSMVAGEAAAAGDTVLVAAGTYSVVNTDIGLSGRFNVAYNPVNDGDSESPIIFRAVGLVTLQTSGNTGPVIGSAQKDYITWDGFYIDEANVNTASDTGPVVAWDCSNVQLLNLKIKGIDPEWGDNHNGIRLEAANYCLIKNCEIYEIGESGYGQNAAGIMMYDSNNNIIEHNNIYTCGSGVFVKGIHDGYTQSGNTIRYNLMYNLGSAGMRFLGSTGSFAYQNIIRDGDTGVTFGFFYPEDDIVANNTIYGCSYGILPMEQDTAVVNELVQNNIIAGNDFAIWEWYGGSPTSQDISYDRNLYYGNAAHARYEAEGTPLNINFSEWQSTYGMDTNGSNADPTFVNAAGGNFKLQDGSPALTLGRTITAIHGSSGETIPAGAYITGSETIGIEGAGSKRTLFRTSA